VSSIPDEAIRARIDWLLHPGPPTASVAAIVQRAHEELARRADYRQLHQPSYRGFSPLVSTAWLERRRDALRALAKRQGLNYGQEHFLTKITEELRMRATGEPKVRHRATPPRR
jgi:hypothetical protein